MSYSSYTMKYVIQRHLLPIETDLIKMNFFIFTAVLCLSLAVNVCDGQNSPTIASIFNKSFCQKQFLKKCDIEWTTLSVSIKYDYIRSIYDIR